jgi:hypothetical protein
LAETLANLILEVQDELGSDLAALFTEDDEYERYLNQGQRRLNRYDEKTASVTWDADDPDADFPSDYAAIDRLVPSTDSYIPQHKIWGKKLRFLHPDGASAAGSATLYYYAFYPTITDAQASTLPADGDTAIVAFACYRFLKRLATSRADYERYATMLGTNGVDIGEIADLAQDYLDEFEQARDSMTAEEPASFFGD